jgi:hypothetical protein
VDGVQQMQTGATDAAMNATTMGATDVDGNKFPKTGVHDLCLGVWVWVT